MKEPSGIEGKGRGRKAGSREGANVRNVLRVNARLGKASVRKARQEKEVLVPKAHPAKEANARKARQEKEVLVPKAHPAKEANAHKARPAKEAHAPKARPAKEANVRRARTEIELPVHKARQAKEASAHREHPAKEVPVHRAHLLTEDRALNGLRVTEAGSQKIEAPVPKDIKAPGRRDRENEPTVRAQITGSVDLVRMVSGLRVLLAKGAKGRPGPIALPEIGRRGIKASGLRMTEAAARDLRDKAQGLKDRVARDHRDRAVRGPWDKAEGLRDRVEGPKDRAARGPRDKAEDHKDKAEGRVRGR